MRVILSLSELTACSELTTLHKPCGAGSQWSLSSWHASAKQMPATVTGKVVCRLGRCSSRKVVVPTGETLQAYDDALDATTSLQESVGGAVIKAFGLSIRQIWQMLLTYKSRFEPCYCWFRSHCSRCYQCDDCCFSAPPKLLCVVGLHTRHTKGTAQQASKRHSWKLCGVGLVLSCFHSVISVASVLHRSREEELSEWLLVRLVPARSTQQNWQRISQILLLAKRSPKQIEQPIIWSVPTSAPTGYSRYLKCSNQSLYSFSILNPLQTKTNDQVDLRTTRDLSSSVLIRDWAKKKSCIEASRSNSCIEASISFLKLTTMHCILNATSICIWCLACLENIFDCRISSRFK